MYLVYIPDPIIYNVECAHIRIIKIFNVKSRKKFGLSFESIMALL